MQFSWIPCDNGLVGLAQLAGEQQTKRLKDAIVVMVRVYLALAGAVACVVLAANPSFVRRWVGPDLFAGSLANTLIAILAIAMTFGHAVAVIPSVLGQRLQIGMATLGCGLLHVVLAITLGMRFGVVGVLAAGVVSHGIVFGLLAWRPFARATKMSEAGLITDVVRPWIIRAAPMIALAVALDWLVTTPPLLVTVVGRGLPGRPRRLAHAAALPGVRSGADALRPCRSMAAARLPGSRSLVTVETRLGRADRFRNRSWLERCVDRMRASHAVPAPRLLRKLHETVLDRWPGDHLVSTLPNGERVRVAARHRGLCWNPDEYRAFHESVRAGAVVFDVGANLGAYTLLFAQWVGPAGRVFAFEPSPPSLAGLRRHLALNALDDRVEVVPAAVCDRTGTATFHLHPHGGASGLYTSTDGASMAVETTSLDRLLRRSQV